MEHLYSFQRHFGRFSLPFVFSSFLLFFSSPLRFIPVGSAWLGAVHVCFQQGSVWYTMHKLCMAAVLPFFLLHAGFCFFLSFSLHVHALPPLLTCQHDILSPWLSTSTLGLAAIYLYSFLFFMAVVSHLFTVITDPGHVPYGAEAEPRDWVKVHNQNKLLPMFCQTCKFYKPYRAHHCRICKRCVTKMDHHCLTFSLSFVHPCFACFHSGPWVNNCVGINNHKIFILFLGYTLALCMFLSSLSFILFHFSFSFSSRLTGALLIAHIGFCMSYYHFTHDSPSTTTKPSVDPKGLQCTLTPSMGLAHIGVLVSCFLFGVFTYVMFSDQVRTISLL